MDIESANESISKLWMVKGAVDYVDNWFLMPSYIPVLSIWIAYMLFVLKLGPNYMKDRPAYHFPTLIVIYNIAQVILSFYVFIICLNNIKPMNYIFVTCRNSKEDILEITGAFYVCLLSKLADFIDTIMFVLRKKFNQVSFLHVYHHSIAVFTNWMILKFEPNPTGLFLLAINGFVHVIMYGYYALSSFPSLQKYLWWKKYITSLQLLQFVIVLTHLVANTIVGECRASFLYTAQLILINISMLYLFGKFYLESYKTPKRHQDKPIRSGTNDEDVIRFNDLKYTNSVSKGTNSYNSMKHRSS